MTRRTFISRAGQAALAVGIGAAASPLSLGAGSSKDSAPMPTRPLGRTGWNASIYSLGGQATLDQNGRSEEAVAIINRALDLGVNYIDTAQLYGGGRSEKNVGQVMKTRRSEVYLATKTINRDYDGAMRDLEGSLKNLQTDHIDCWQLHTVRSEEDAAQIFSSRGALKALEKARDEKIVRFLGITGHKQPFILKRSIERFPFDTILMALNPADRSMPNNENDASFIENLLPVAVEKKMGIIGMKVASGGRMFQGAGFGSIEQSLNYVLSLPISTVVVGITKLDDLTENIRLAKAFQPLPAEEMARIEDIYRPHAAEATWFKQAW
jgi:aryl-alcohol dehydrogenase-like predicted oxidoreductase